MKTNHVTKYLLSASLIVNLQAQTFTIDELIMLSLENSPDLQVSHLNYKASQSRYDSAFASYLPQVDLLASGGKIAMSDMANPASNTLLEDTLLLGKLSVNQILYDFGKRGGNVDNLEYRSQAYNFQDKQNISNKIKDVKGAYYTVLKTAALIDVQKENVKLNEAQVYRSQKYFEAGIRTKIDVSDAKVFLIQAKLQLKNVEYELKSAYALLDKTVGFLDTQEEYSLQTQKLNLNTLYNSLYQYDLSLQESIDFAYKNRAELQKYAMEIEASTSKIEQFDSEYYPELFLSADYTKQQLDTLSSFTPEDQWQATVNLNWNLYAGGASNARVEESKLLTKSSEYQYTYSKLAIKKEITDAYINVNRSKDFVELAQSLVQVSAQKFEQASKRYEHGLSDYIELQQARQEYIDAKAKLVADYYDYYIAIANLDNAIGK
ncbi:MAG: TolC family protein [Campylobacterales bacterium]|nr:TolC family protein [Campylobacterales bacterium]